MIDLEHRVAIKSCPFCGKQPTYTYRYNTRMYLTNDSCVCADYDDPDGETFAIGCSCGCTLSIHMDMLNDRLLKEIDELSEEKKCEILDDVDQWLFKMLDMIWNERCENGN